ncbi:UDP-3-O-acyl-N-acetylglucosamine deacetylase [Lutimaribacter sp. EGI FJ00015]|uniref:UDP-3-O-acyl-N-acetylglucosamine deacetylase n=1 Tax=Lutimaribacter degradans TaxID=2945989 RepID=A0ACC5ZQV6_9RHOB|nr:UDP-3-O-acyl-N-acetylglucosamine deacetylase [Lutimaribacter sp. EGI FJ00013]MCO0612363.1 UDP-3-O-acyl-N-acetylglucosamine deacetylase [Lutimaribacter sp. EGI FJ00015]MCO0634517.1 UDP-3-O-acyl-N-acetylglucosamine deacetylase [Lutimaribacter sp. EGI FJ00014]
MQATLNTAVIFSGVGLHSGKPARMIVRPAPVDHGIVFRRTDLPLADNRVPARWDAVNQSPLCTLLENAQGVTVSTVEHIMAALAGCGVHNALIDIDGPEVPILDGSASHFVSKILACGVSQQASPVRAIEVLERIEVRRGDAWARLDPAATLTIDFHIDFTDPAIGRQHKVLNMSNGSFVRELCDSRTFCRKADVDTMRANGLALGGTFENAVVVDGDRVLSPGGLRHRDEAVRHKMLDALGDLSLAGAPLFAAYTGHRAGHALTNDLLRALFDRPLSWRWVTCDAAMSARLPGAGVHPGEMRHVA